MKLPRRLQLLRGPLDLTPLIDVVFLLLIFFMLSSTLIVQPGFRIDLPRSTFGQATQTDNLIVSILMEPERRDPVTGQFLKREPILFFNDQVMDMTALQRRLQEIAQGRTGPSLVIKADQEVPHGVIVAIMNMALSLKWSIVLATQRPE
jgi:biopolymer transport protein ExbD